jgi:sugar phosphate isomerase/epimerase
MKVSVNIRQSKLLPELRTNFEKYILQTFTTHNSDIFSLHQYDEIFTHLRDAGIDGVELLVSNDLTDKQIEKTKTLLMNNHITVLSIHQPQSFSQLIHISLSDIRKLCELANTFSTKIVVLHIDAIGKRLFDASFVKSLTSLQETYNIQIGFENAPKYILTLDKSFSWGASAFASVISRNKFHMTLDTSHLAQVGGNIVEFYKQYKESICNIHISDYRSSFKSKKLLLATGQHLPLGNGELPIKEFLKTLKETHYKGLITMEIDADLDDLCSSAKLIKQYTLSSPLLDII